MHHNANRPSVRKQTVIDFESQGPRSAFRDSKSVAANGARVAAAL